MNQKETYNMADPAIVKALNKIKKQVFKREPEAKLVMDSDKNFSVIVRGKNICAEYHYPKTKSAFDAWKHALEALKITQNINRTHPLRYDMELKEDGNQSVKRRMSKRRKGIDNQ